jgi:acyl carrier protein
MSALDITAFPNRPNGNSMNHSVQQRVVKTIAEVLNRKESEIRLDASIRDDLQASSLEQMTIFVALEDEFQRNMPPEEVTGLTTVKAIIGFIERKLQESSPA